MQTDFNAIYYVAVMVWADVKQRLGGDDPGWGSFVDGVKMTQDKEFLIQVELTPRPLFSSSLFRGHSHPSSDLS